MFHAGVGRDEEFDADIWIEVQSMPEPELPGVPEQCEDWCNKASLRNKIALPELLLKSQRKQRILLGGKDLTSQSLSIVSNASTIISSSANMDRT
jgi:hypothetical protein